MASAGKFKIEISSPYPVWCTLKYDGLEIRFHHKELSDLKYAVEKAMQEARSILGPDREEV